MHLQDLCSRYNIRFKRQLGQNLLVDDNINRIMVEAANLTRDDDVIEVGAGLGALTRYLHPVARRVLAIEIDFSFMPCLEDRFGGVDNVVLFRGDVLNHGVDKLAAEFLPDGERFICSRTCRTTSQRRYSFISGNRPCPCARWWSWFRRTWPCG